MKNLMLPHYKFLVVVLMYIFLKTSEQTSLQCLAPRSELMTYIGVQEGVKGYRFMRPNGAMFLGATATFDETFFPHCKGAVTPLTTEFDQLPPDVEEHNHSHGSNNDGDDDFGPAPSSYKQPPSVTKSSNDTGNTPPDSQDKQREQSAHDDAAANIPPSLQTASPRTQIPPLRTDTQREIDHTL